MGASQSQAYEDNRGFHAQNRRGDSRVAESIAGARPSNVRTTRADQKTKEAGESSEVRAISVVEIDPTSRVPVVQGKKEEIKLPFNQDAILKKADSEDYRRPQVKLSAAQLQAGVLLSGKRKKYWVDQKSNKNCYMLFAKDLAITWAEDKRYWKWREDTSDVTIPVAVLMNVCWLEVHGKFNTAKLSPETLYKVAFVVMLEDPACGWEVPVNIKLTLPNGSKQEHKEDLIAKPRGQWIEIPVGEFKTPPTNAGKIEFSMYEYEGGNWKTGLVIKGAIIQPKN
ncbi:hypothetical protein SLEP1_g44957 [Rubroshorea leprosula]|uniref:Uncharacterized protein n=1 Tax=Rubroshorea leprosula TaxID=152421 RepID=A0AAV5LHU4_9ROSI|nr:hypothetical protein SLEP1_g44957 [Rubroshorea leprosula]